MITVEEMPVAPHPWKMTSTDLRFLPDDNKRYEIIEGELFVSRQPGFEHQFSCGQTHYALEMWNRRTNSGVAIFAPGVIFADDDDVAPDVVWISHERLTGALDAAGHLLVAPELAVEVLSPGSRNEQRDREFKLKLYSRRGVAEYWIINWMRRLVEIYRRENAALRLVATLYDNEALTTPLLPDFSCQVADLFYLPRVTAEPK